MEKPAISRRSGGKSQFKMIDVGSKTSNRRYAVASGRIRVGEDVFYRIKEKRMPKGDVLALAEVAGIMAAKRAPDFIPLCHPLSLDQVVVRCEPEESTFSIRVVCEAVATAKTGVEMEALAGVNVALLSIYDLCKGVNPALWVSDIHLELKEGGKSGHWVHPEAAGRKEAAGDAVSASALKGLSVAVLTVSDRVSQKESKDASGPMIAAFVTERGAKVVAQAVVPDQRSEISGWIKKYSTDEKVDLILSTGGTGLGPRDVTPEALHDVARSVGARLIPGIGELLRTSGSRHTPMAWLSRSDAALIGSTLVIVLPGSPSAVLEGLAMLEDLIPHAHHIVRGGGHSK